MSWIAEYDTQGREFPTCVHVTKTTGTMTHGATYVPIEDGKAVRAENAKLRELVARVERARRDLCDAYPDAELLNCEDCPAWSACKDNLMDHMREFGIEVIQ